MEKSPDAFRTISEVADDLDLPQHVLRFWETRFSQIKPLKRGGGRRYYRPDDVHLLRGIKHLLYGEGYTIKGVQRILRENGLRHVMGLWRDEVSEPEPLRDDLRSHEAYAPKADRPRGLEPLDPGENGPGVYAKGASVTARRPNFEPIIGEEEDGEEEDEETEELENEESEDAEASDEEEDAENEESDDEEENEDDADEDSAEDEDDEEEDDEEGENEDEDDAAGLSDESRKKLEQALRDLTELRQALDRIS
jgi:DNA-binding transcriptional MerR regulator